MTASGRKRTQAGFRFGTRSSVTQEHLPSLRRGSVLMQMVDQVILGYAGCRLARTENPRVGGSIPPLATINSL